MDRRAFTTVGLLVREMRRNGRSIDFVGLTNTLLTDSDVLHLVSVLESLPSPQADSKMRPSLQLEIKQTALTAPVRERLMAAGNAAALSALRSHALSARKARGREAAGFYWQRAPRPRTERSIPLEVSYSFNATSQTTRSLPTS